MAWLCLASCCLARQQVSRDVESRSPASSIVAQQSILDEIQRDEGSQTRLMARVSSPLHSSWDACARGRSLASP